MTHPVKCFLLEETGISVVEVWNDKWTGCPSPLGPKHNAVFEVYRGPLSTQPVGSHIGKEFSFTCRNCGAITGPLKATSSGSHRLWRRADTGEEKSRISEFGPGAMWFADWYKTEKTSPTGRALYGWDWDNQFEPPLMVATPGGDWNVDSRCSNCTLRDDRLHRCWIRHGAPPMITVDKAGGLTCAAGAGSIQAGNYHGFLTNGILSENR